MGVSEALRDAREYKGWTQGQVATRCNISLSAISKAENGERKTPRCATKEIINTLDDGLLALAMMEEALEVPFITVLDGPNVDLHRSSVKDKTIEELTEALELVKMISLSDVPQFANESKRRELRKCMDHLVDSVFASVHYIAVVCREYPGMSFTGVWEDHRVKLKSRGYVR